MAPKRNSHGSDDEFEDFQVLEKSSLYNIAAIIQPTEKGGLVVNENFTDEEEDDMEEETAVPDGGWGWMVCLASFVVNFVIDGTMFSFGILLLALLEDLGEDKATTSWVGSAQLGCSMIMGPAVSLMLKKYSIRQVTFAGTIFSTIGFISSVFAPNVYVLIFTFGVIGGIGFGMIFLPAIIVVGLYFNKKRAIATGIATSGSGLGTFAYAYITDNLLEGYHWRGTILILSGILLNCLVCAMLFRPLVPKVVKYVEIEPSNGENCPEDDRSASSGYSSDHPTLHEKSQLCPPIDNAQINTLRVVNDYKQKTNGEKESKTPSVSRSGTYELLTPEEFSPNTSAFELMVDATSSKMEEQNQSLNSLSYTQGVNIPKNKNINFGSKDKSISENGSNVSEENLDGFDNNDNIVRNEFDVTNETKSMVPGFERINRFPKAQTASPLLLDAVKNRQKLAHKSLKPRPVSWGSPLAVEQNKILIKNKQNCDLYRRNSHGEETNRERRTQNSEHKQKRSSKHRVYEEESKYNVTKCGSKNSIRSEIRKTKPNETDCSESGKKWFQYFHFPFLQKDFHSKKIYLGRGYKSAEHLHHIARGSNPNYYNANEVSPLVGSRLLTSEYRLDSFGSHAYFPNKKHGAYSRVNDINAESHTDMQTQSHISKGLLRPILRKDIYYSGSVSHLPAFHHFGSLNSFMAAMTRVSSQDNSADVITAKSETCAQSKCGRKLRKIFPLYLIKNKIFLLLLVACTTWTAQSVSLTYLPDLAVTLGIERSDAAFLISIVGIANVLGRLLAGFITDCFRIPSVFLYGVALTTAAVVNFFIPTCNSYGLLAASSAVFGLCMAVAVSMRTIVLAEQLGIEVLTESFGIVALFQGIAFTVTPPIAGKLIDESHSFTPPFFLSGAMYAISAVSTVLVWWLGRREMQSRRRRQNNMVQIRVNVEDGEKIAV